MIMRVFKSFVFFCGLFSITVYAAPCEEAFSDPDSFYKAMSQQLFLGKEGQQSLFEFYFKSKTPYPQNIYVKPESLELVLNILNQYPELSKLPVREQILEFGSTP